MNFAEFDIAERAAFYLGKGFHSSQTVLHVVQDLLGEEDEAAVRMMGGFGGGIGGMGSVCGAIIGGVAALGLTRGKGTIVVANDPFALDVNQGVGGAEIDREIVGEPTKN